MTAPDVEEQIAELRPLLTRTLRVVWPHAALIDCARVANEVLDHAEQGNRRPLGVVLGLLERVAASARVTPPGGEQ